MTELAHIEVVVRLGGHWNFRTEVMHRLWAELIFYELPHGPFEVRQVEVVNDRVVAHVIVGGGWDFTSEALVPGQAGIFAHRLLREGFDVAAGAVISETEA